METNKIIQKSVEQNLSNENATNPEYTFIDLFCGIGGFSLGFLKAGFKHKGGIDNWISALDTYSLNKIGVTILEDLRLNSLEGFENNIDVIIGSPPCQTFSKANIKNRECNLNLIHIFFQIVNKLKPKVWILENVPEVFNLIKVPYKYIFDMSEYGLLQKRRRYFASNIPLNILGPKNKYLSKEQIEKKEKFRANQIHKQFSTITGRYNSFSKTDPSIEDKRGIRCLNHEEALAIQTFPFYFRLPEGLTQRETEQLIGNAVPPAFAYKIALCIKEYLEKWKQIK